MHETGVPWFWKTTPSIPTLRAGTTNGWSTETKTKTRPKARASLVLFLNSATSFSSSHCHPANSDVSSFMLHLRSPNHCQISILKDPYQPKSSVQTNYTRSHSHPIGLLSNYAWISSLQSPYQSKIETRISLSTKHDFIVNLCVLHSRLLESTRLLLRSATGDSLSGTHVHPVEGGSFHTDRLLWIASGQMACHRLACRMFLFHSAS